MLPDWMFEIVPLDDVAMRVYLRREMSYRSKVCPDVSVTIDVLVPFVLPRDGGDWPERTPEPLPVRELRKRRGDQS